MQNSQENSNRPTKGLFLPYQLRWLEDNSRIKIWEKSRRIGATYVQSYEDVRDCVTKKYFMRGKPLAVWFSSADITAAKEYILYCKEWAEMFNDIAKDLGEIIIDPDKDVKAFAIEFKNGSRIHALSSNPTQFRSKGGKVILDEFAHHDNQTQLWKAANASAFIWGFPIRILSTHNGKGCQYYKFIEKVLKGILKWGHHSTPIQLAVEEGLADKICEKPLTEAERQQWLDEVKDNAGDEQTWQEEYCCNPLDESTAFLTYELISSCESDNILLPLEKTIGGLFVGFDVGRKKDLSIITVGEEIGDVIVVRMVIEIAKTMFKHQREVLFKILSHKNFKRCCIDATGIGMQIAEEAQQKFGKYKVEDITFTNRIKEAMGFELRTRFEDRTVRIPDYEEYREDLHSIRRSQTVTGKIRLDADRNETDGHGDRFWSLALMLSAASNQKGSSIIASAKKTVQKYSSFMGQRAKDIINSI